jgi:hypothetical protein
VTFKTFCLAALASLLPWTLFAQTSDFAGTWKLDGRTSRVSAEAGLIGLIGAGAPELLHILQPTNGTIVLESEINESHARMYVPGGETSTPVFVGQPGKITMRSRWQNRSLVSEGARELASGDSTAAVQVKESFTLRDGGRLEIEVTTSDAEGPRTSTFVYTRTHGVGPCESWASPCKSPPR